MKKLFISTLILTLASCTAKDPNIIGRWEKIWDKGTTISAVIRADHTYEGYNNNRMFIKGMYSFKDSNFTFETDEMAECGDTKGTYKLTFLADTAMRFDALNDECEGRNKGTNGVVFVKVKD